jgi:hypothetical protein
LVDGTEGAEPDRNVHEPGQVIARAVPSDVSSSLKDASIVLAGTLVIEMVVIAAFSDV